MLSKVRTPCPCPSARPVRIVLYSQAGPPRTTIISVLGCGKTQCLGAVRGVCCINQWVLLRTVLHKNPTQPVIRLGRTTGRLRWDMGWSLPGVPQALNQNQNQIHYSNDTVLPYTTFLSLVCYPLKNKGNGLYHWRHSCLTLRCRRALEGIEGRPAKPPAAPLVSGAQ